MPESLEEPDRSPEPLSVAESVAGRLGENSDLDVGIYYWSSKPPSVETLRQLARDLDAEACRAEVTDFGEWGPWVNGGAWLQIHGLKVDWLYRDLELVSKVIEDCCRGVVTCDYYLGHPHGFHNHIYLAEVHYGRLLHDPSGVFAELKKSVAVYPEQLKQALVSKFLYDANFMLELARSTASRGDAFHVSGCLFRCAAALVQVLFALNETYFMNEKGAVSTADSFSIKPPSFASRITGILSRPGEVSDALQARVDEMASLISETSFLAKTGSGWAAKRIESRAAPTSHTPR